MFVRDLLQRLRLMPAGCVMQARIPGPDGDRVEGLVRAHHHNHDPDEPVAGYPVEMYVGNEGTLSVADMAAQLSAFHEGDLVRVAVPIPMGPDDTVGHHRVLDVVSVGFSPDPGEQPPVEVTTERWDSLAMVVRRDDIEIV